MKAVKEMGKTLDISHSNIVEKRSPKETERFFRANRWFKFEEASSFFELENLRYTRKMKTAVIFDADGVLIRSEPFTVALERKFGIEQSVFIPFFRDRFPLCLTGQSELQVELDSFLPSTRWSQSSQCFMKFWFDSENKTDQNLIGEIKKLKREGFLIGVGTNQEQNRMEFMKKDMGFERLFDVFFPSHEIGYRKPEQRYFDLVSRDLASRGIDRIVFFDDRLENVAAAIDSGWEAFQYESISDFKEWNQNRAKRSVFTTPEAAPKTS